MRPRGYWSDVENVKKEIDSFNAERGTPGVMPKEDELKARGRSSLAFAIQKCGGFPRFARDYGYLTFRKPNGYYADFEVLKAELLRWVTESGVAGVMPTAQQLKDNSPPRNDLVKAISQHGGPAGVAKKLGLRMTHDKQWFPGIRLVPLLLHGPRYGPLRRLSGRRTFYNSSGSPVARIRDLSRSGLLATRSNSTASVPLRTSRSGGA